MIVRPAVLSFIFFFAAAPLRPQALQIDASLPYAFHGWNTTGYSADLGGFFAGHNFLGLEFSAFSPTLTQLYPGLGPVQTRQRIESLLIAYRYYFALARFGIAGDYTPLELYLGAGAGPGWVREALSYSPAAPAVFGAKLSADNTELGGELAAGIQFNFGPHFGIKGGYRYIDSFNNVKQFGTDTNTDTKTVEIGVVFRL